MVGKTALILLAAGASRRMGQVKQLLPIQGEPALRFSLKRILLAGITEVTVVLGHNRDSLLPILAGLPVSWVINPDPHSHMADSLQVGLAGLPPGITGILIGLADHPAVLPATYKLLRHQHEMYPEQILLPTYRHRGGHPVLLPASLFRLTDNPKPLNQRIADHPDTVLRLAVDDPGVIMDMDNLADYHRLVSLVGEQQKADREELR